MEIPQLSKEVIEILKQMEMFEAAKSISNVGAGARREGQKFELLIEEMWLRFGNQLENGGAKREIYRGQGKRSYYSFTVDQRSLFIPAPANSIKNTSNLSKYRWLETSFQVSDLVSSFPSEAEAIKRYAPTSGPYAGNCYPNIYSGLRTIFDDTIILVNEGVLFEKILLEYKTAKSSSGDKIDGNAHERLSFQILQYLEAATRYTKCSFVVIANGAFAYYRNKYHVSFHIQADRLRNFSWFNMDYICTQPKYVSFLNRLASWLFDKDTDYDRWYS